MMEVRSSELPFLTAIKTTYDSQTESIIDKLSWGSVSNEILEIFCAERQRVTKSDVRSLYPVVPFDRFHGRLVGHAHSIINDLKIQSGPSNVLDLPLDHLFILSCIDISLFRNLLIRSGGAAGGTLKALDQVNRSIIQTLSEHKVGDEIDLCEVNERFEKATQQAIFHQVFSTNLDFSDGLKDAMWPLHSQKWSLIEPEFRLVHRDRVRQAVRELEKYFKACTGAGAVKGEEESDLFRLTSENQTLDMAYLSPPVVYSSNHNDFERCMVDFRTKAGRSEFRDGLREIMRGKLASKFSQMNTDVALHVIEKARARLEWSQRVGTATYVAFEALSFTYQLGRRLIIG